MFPFVAVAALGFVLGVRHATDPDHVVAVTTIVSREGKVGRAAAIGALWGVGHTLTILAVGSAIVLFGIVIPPRLGLSMEFSVAIMLVLLGIANLTIRRVAGEDAVARAHPHPHAVIVSRHDPAALARRERWIDRAFGGLTGYQLVRPLAVGIVHGLAGSAAVALLALATIRDPAWAVLYLGVFGVGTVCGMMLITAAIGVPFATLKGRLSRWNRRLSLAAGLGSTAFGLFLVYHIGWVDGLFSGAPRWTPR